ncbi:hypothetical protein [Methylobacterium sp. NFXW15]|uniref:hypothetical protein n=1 Tax=Methylobacterium sp. NFXW15 TaxID=2819512 RepID=UPI003CF17C64
MKPQLSSPADAFALICDAASSAVRYLGLTYAPWQLSPGSWQRMLVAVEAWAKMRSLTLPFGWRDKLAVQMGRAKAAAYDGLES